MTTYYITKYALTKGIIQEDGDEYVSDEQKYASFRGLYSLYPLGSEAFDNEPDAKAHAEKMRLAKIVSLQRQIKKLEALKF